MFWVKVYGHILPSFPSLYIDPLTLLVLFTLCPTTAAAVQPPSEERCVSDKPASAPQDAAATKTESLESNTETETDHPGNQEKGFAPQLAEQGKTGTPPPSHCLTPV